MDVRTLEKPASENKSDYIEHVMQNLLTITEQSQQLLSEFMSHQQAPESVIAVSLEGAVTAFQQMLAKLAENPEEYWLSLFDLWQSYLTLWANTASRMMGEELPPAYEPSSKDRRFMGKSWSEHLVFDYFKQSYLLVNRWVEQQLQSPEIRKLDKQQARLIEFYSRQMMNALSPSNYPLTNPEVLEEMLRTGGDTLVKGLNNILNDLKKFGSKPSISTSDDNAFAVGKDLATTPGKVVFCNRLLELIQYTPSTDNVFATPLLVISPWINKYYVLDMRPENSLIRWLVEQGHTVFVTSWVNPDASMKDVTFDDYLKDGALMACEVIREITSQQSVNVMGYCIGGTLLAAMLAYLKVHKQESRVASATFLTTLTDFSEPGDLGVFISEAQLAAVKEIVDEEGIFNGRYMSSIFSLLRSNEMIWSFVVNNYLLGKDPLPFDLLYWNADNTSMPAAMYVEYLRNMYLENRFCKPGAMKLLGTPIDLSKITTPSYFLSTREDHIAPWQSTYAATQLFRAPLRFVLSGSGHVAGVVNPVGKGKYGYWINESANNAAKNYPVDPDVWLENAKAVNESWWLDWQRWVNAYAGDKLPAREPGSKKYPPLMAAPGSYVLKKIAA